MNDEMWNNETRGSPPMGQNLDRQTETDGGGFIKCGRRPRRFQSLTTLKHSWM